MIFKTKSIFFHSVLLNIWCGLKGASLVVFIFICSFPGFTLSEKEKHMLMRVMISYCLNRELISNISFGKIKYVKMHQRRLSVGI